MAQLSIISIYGKKNLETIEKGASYGVGISQEILVTDFYFFCIQLCRLNNNRRSKNYDEGDCFNRFILILNSLWGNTD